MSSGYHGSLPSRPSDRIGVDMYLHQKYVDDTDFTGTADVEKLDLIIRANSHRNTNHKSVKIKLAAIYDDDGEICQILRNETRNNSVQNLLSMQDERGQPCIFHAIESHSKKALACLLQHVKNKATIIASNGESVLHVATKIGDVDILKRLLALEIVAALVNDVDRENGRAPLHLAVKFNHVEIAKELLLNGARLDLEDMTGKTPIFTTASRGLASMLEVFLQYGCASISIENRMLDSSLYGKFYDNLLQVAVESGDVKTVNVCLDQDPEIVRKCLENEIKHGDGGLIHSACKNGMKHCLLRIVESMEDLEKLHFNRKDRKGLTPIHQAAINNHDHLVKYLGSISKLFVNQTTKFSQTAILLAAERGHFKVVEELLNLKANFHIPDERGKTVVHGAIAFPDVLTLLLQQRDLCGLLINAKEKDGHAPIHMAASKGLSDSLNILLKYGAEMNVFTNTSRSPLHFAVSSQVLEVVELVLSNEPHLVNKADDTGKTPIHTAASYGSVDVVRCLLDYGAQLVRDGNMHSALHIAAHKGHLDVVEFLVEFNRNIINWQNKYGRTALVAAALTGKSDVVKFLLENDAAITQDCELFNCLDWCLIKNDKETAMTMMAHPRWRKILDSTNHGSEGTMEKLVTKMPEVALLVLSNSVTSQGHPDTKKHVKRYDFFCLQNSLQDKQKIGKLKPLTAIETMITSKCYSCLCHPVCCKFLKAKWMEFGWKVHILSLLIYIIFLVALNIYAFQIPTYKETQQNANNIDAPAKVKIAMVICLLFTSVNVIKEFIQLIVYRHRYFLDTVNYLECAMYMCVFVFAIPSQQNIAVKTSLQWQACSVALFFAWINLALYLRRFGSHGIYVLMMKKICATLIKVLSLLIFFFVAFAAAFVPIMNDTRGFENLGMSTLTSAAMTLGEFDYKQTFLGDMHETFQVLRVLLLIVFIVLMPIVLMNLLLALAIDDTRSIMQQAKLSKHIQMAKIIIDLERKRYLFPWAPRAKTVPLLEECPNKRVHLPMTMWEYMLYGPDFTSDDDTTPPHDVPTTPNERLGQKLMIDMMKEVKNQVMVLQQGMDEIQNAHAQRDCLTHAPSKEVYAEERRNNWIQFRGENVNFESRASDVVNAGDPAKRNSSTQYRGRFQIHRSDPNDDVPGDYVFPEAQDVKDEKASEEKECDPELIELKELHKKTPEAEDEKDGRGDDDNEENGIELKLFQRIEESSHEDEHRLVV